MEYQGFVIYMCLLASSEINGYRTIKSAEDIIIFAKTAEKVDLVCENDIPLARCGFTHPNGTGILFQNLLPGTPSCTYSTEASATELGVWTCHFWAQTAPQQELRKMIDVRVADAFAAVEREVVAKEGEEVSLSCISTERLAPLNYCYFLTPAMERIHIMDDEVTTQSPLNEKYFFPRNKSIHRGDCGVTIKSVAFSDSGDWSCFGWVESEYRQYSDIIRLTVEGDVENAFLDEPITISVATYVCGTIAFLGLFVVLVYYKYRFYSRYYNKTFGDDDSVASLQLKPHEAVTSNYLLIT